MKVSPTSIALSYAGSKNLAYSEEDGERQIHKVYVAWTDALVKSVQRRLKSLCTDLGQLQSESSAGASYRVLAERNPFLGKANKTLVVKSSPGSQIG